MIADQKKDNERKKLNAIEEKEAGDKVWAKKWAKHKTTLKEVQSDTSSKYKNRKSGTPKDSKFEGEIDKLHEKAEYVRHVESLPYNQKKD